MSRKAYSEEEREAIRTGMLDTAARLFTERGVKDTGVEDIYGAAGISKTFFYTFFPSKTDLVIATLRREHALILEALRSYVWELGAKEGLRATLRDLTAGRWFVSGMTDQVYLRSVLSEREFFDIQGDLTVLIAEAMDIVGIPVSRLDPRVFFNMVMGIVWVRVSHEDCLPFLFPGSIDASTERQLDMLVDYLYSLSVNAPSGS